MSGFQELLDILMPSRCVLCRQLGAPVCLNCEESLKCEPRVAKRGNLTGLVAGNYDQANKAVLKAFKEHGQTVLSRHIATRLAPMLLQLLLVKSNSEPSKAPTYLVPVPSNRLNFLKRGYTPARMLASSTNFMAGRPCLVLDALRFQRLVADQSGLSISERINNLAGAMRASETIQGCRVILLDDVVTTGTTLIEAARAVTIAGGEVIGFLAFSETLLKTPVRN